MHNVIRSLLLALGQLTDPTVLRLLAKTVMITLLIFAAIGVATYHGLVAAAANIGASLASEATYLMALVVTLLAGWLLFRIIALAVLQFFADEIVIAVERLHYPAAAKTARKLPLHEDLANSLRGMGRALLFNALAAPVALVLVLTAIGPAVVFAAVNAVLLGRELTDIPWLRHRTAGAPAQPPVAAGKRLFLGATVTALMFVPVVNLLAPVIGAAAGTHLYHLTRKREGHA